MKLIVCLILALPFLTASCSADNKQSISEGPSMRLGMQYELCRSLLSKMDGCKVHDRQKHECLFPNDEDFSFPIWSPVEESVVINVLSEARRRQCDKSFGPKCQSNSGQESEYFSGYYDGAISELDMNRDGVSDHLLRIDSRNIPTKEATLHSRMYLIDKNNVLLPHYQFSLDGELFFFRGVPYVISPYTDEIVQVFEIEIFNSDVGLKSIPQAKVCEIFTGNNS